MSMGVENLVGLRLHVQFYTSVSYQDQKISVQGNCRSVNSDNRKGDNDRGGNILQTQSVF